jgi:adenine deaminase
MAFAVNRLGEIQGGYVVVADGKVLAELPLRIAGLMSTEPFEAIPDKLRALRRAAADLGCTLADPFLTVAFLPLPVIPHMKITDFGLFDVDKFALVEM